MKNLNIALRSLFKKGRSNGIKILSLGVGLAMGLVLISKCCFERSFDKFYPDSDRIYRLHENIIRDGEYKSYGQVSGAWLQLCKSRYRRLKSNSFDLYRG